MRVVGLGRLMAGMGRGVGPWSSGARRLCLTGSRSPQAEVGAWVEVALISTTYLSETDSHVVEFGHGWERGRRTWLVWLSGGAWRVRCAPWGRAGRAAVFLEGLGGATVRVDIGRSGRG